MRWKSQIILFVILIILGSWYYFYEIKGEPDRKHQEMEAKRIFSGIETADINYFEFRRIPLVPEMEKEIEGIKFIFKKIDSKWTVDYPIKTDADNTLINNLVDRFVQIQADKIIPKKDTSLDLFGLNKPAFIIKFKSGSDSTTKEYICRLGDENPTKEYLYAQTGHNNDIALVSNTLKKELLKNLYEYRDRRIIPFQGQEITSISFHRQNAESIKIVKQNDEWILTEPIEAKGNQSGINEIINALENQNIKKFVSESYSELSLYGLDNPEITLSISHGDSQKEYQLFFGDYSSESGKYRFARSESKPIVFTVSEDLVEKFPDKVFDIRNKNICEFNRENITQIHLEYPAASYQLEKTDSDEWKMTSPESFIADQEMVGSILSNISYLRATGIMDNQTEFGKRYATITLIGDNQASAERSILKLIFGGIPKDGVGRLVKTNKHSTIFRVSNDDVKKLIKELFDFRQKELISFHKTNLKQIKVNTPSNSIVFEPHRDSWRVIHPEKADLNESDLENIFWALHRLNMTSIVSENNSDFSSFGLDKPQVSVQVELDSSILGPIHFGNRTSDNLSVFVRLAESDRVVTVNAKQIEELFKIITYTSNS